MVLLLGLGAAISYGVSDFIAAIATRRGSAFGVAAVSQAVAAVVIGAAALVEPGVPRAPDLWWAVVAGLGNGAGNVFLYQGLGTGRMAVVAPLSAVATAGLPVVVGLAAGERPGPLPVCGVALALPAIWLVSLGGPGLRHARRRDVASGLAAGVGFGIQFAALGQVAARGGLAPLALSQAISVVAVAAAATVARARWAPRDGTGRRAAVAGALAGIATVWFQLAAQRGLLSVASVLTALYPAVTVALATLILDERIGRAQGVGLGLAAGAVVLIVSG